MKAFTNTIQERGKQQAASVVMPSFNQASFIEQSVRSVLTQSDALLEVIVMDGGSTDGTQTILNQLAQETHGKLHWYSEADQGPAHAVNKAMAMAQGDIIGWLNTDDLYMPGALERAVQALNEHSEWLMVYGHGQHIDEHNQPIGYYPTRQPNTSLQAFADGCFICQPTVFLRKEVLNQHGGLDENLKTAFDLEWWLRIFSQHHNAIGFIDALQACSRLHSDCITLNQRKTVIRESMRVLSHYLGSCPLHWFKTYANEVLANCPDGQQACDLNMHLKEFAQNISEYLSDADKQVLHNLLETGINTKPIVPDAYQEKRPSPTKQKPKTSSLIRTLAKPFKYMSKAHKIEKKQARLLKESGLFDEAWYLAKYPDIANADIDPITHYLLYGASEGRNPSPKFDTIFYLATNPDITIAEINPLIHYIQFGQEEGRPPLSQGITA